MKKELFLLFTFYLLENVAISQDLKYSQQLINRFEQIKSYNSSVLKNGNNRPLCISPILAEVKRNWNKLTVDAKNYFKFLVARPTLSGPEEIEYSYYFDIHYTLSGSDAVDPTDNDFNGVPDYIDFMSAIFDSIYLADSLRNFTMPPSDFGKGGTFYYDVYVGNIDNWIGQSGIYGFVSPDSLIGDNPRSPAIVEINATTSYVAMRNNYSGFLGTEKNNIRVTFAHEFSHSIDFGYTNQLSGVFMEAKGPWEEQKLFPNIYDNLQYIPAIFCMPDVALNWDDSEGPNYQLHSYGVWIFYKYITEHTNDDIMRKFLTGMINIPIVSVIDELDVVDSVLNANWSGGGFYSMFVNFLIANAIMDNNPIFSPYTYSKASVYSSWLTSSTCGGLEVEGYLNYTGTSNTWDSDIDGNGRLMRLGADYFDITANQNFSLALNADNPSTDLDLILIKYNSTTNAFAVNLANAYGNDTIIVTDQSMYDTFLAIVFYPDYYVTDTLSGQYTLTIGAPPVNTDIENNISKNEYVNVFPNPASNYININYKINSKYVNVEITDLLGKTLFYSQNLNSLNKFSINTENWQNGIYYLIIKDDSKIFSSKKIVITK